MVKIYLKNALIVVLSLGIFSCQQKDILEEETLKEEVTRIENIVKNGKLIPDPFMDSNADLHIDFLRRIDYLQYVNNEEEFNYELKQLVPGINTSDLKSGNIFDDAIAQLTEEERQIIESYRKALNMNSLLATAQVATIYISELSKSENIKQESKEKLIYGIGFHKSLITFLETETELSSENLKSAQFRPCPGRSCYSCCMYREFQGTDDWNIVDWAAFMVAPHKFVAWRAGSCGYQCVF